MEIFPAILPYLCSDVSDFQKVKDCSKDRAIGSPIFFQMVIGIAILNFNGDRDRNLDFGDCGHALFTYVYIQRRHEKVTKARDLCPNGINVPYDLSDSKTHLNKA